MESIEKVNKRDLSSLCEYDQHTYQYSEYISIINNNKKKKKEKKVEYPSKDLKKKSILSSLNIYTVSYWNINTMQYFLVEK